MNKKITAIVIIPMLGLLTAGCATSTSNARKDDGTYIASTHLLLRPGFADRSFNSSKDYMFSTEFNDVTYIWPRGKGNFSKDTNLISFEGTTINCSVIERKLSINGRRIAEFEKGDRVRITGEGKVFVNDVELKEN